MIKEPKELIKYLKFREIYAAPKIKPWNVPDVLLYSKIKNYTFM
jgi:hypothetical protein